MHSRKLQIVASLEVKDHLRVSMLIPHRGEEEAISRIFNGQLVEELEVEDTPKLTVRRVLITAIVRRSPKLLL